MDEQSTDGMRKLLKTEVQPSRRLVKAVQMVSNFRSAGPWREVRDRPAVLAASAELVISMLKHIEREVAGA